MSLSTRLTDEQKCNLDIMLAQYIVFVNLNFLYFVPLCVSSIFLPDALRHVYSKK